MFIIVREKGNIGDLDNKKLGVNMNGKGEWEVITLSLYENNLAWESRSKWKEIKTRNVAFRGIGTNIKPWILSWA